MPEIETAQQLERRRRGRLGVLHEIEPHLLDLLPARSVEWVAAELAQPRGPRSLSTHLKTRLKLSGVKAGLLYEVADKATLADAPRLAALIKALPLTLTATNTGQITSDAGGLAIAVFGGTTAVAATLGVLALALFLLVFTGLIIAVKNIIDARIQARLDSLKERPVKGSKRVRVTGTRTSSSRSGSAG